MIYLDHNASTPVAPEVREAMLPYLADAYGNPSSAHAMGRALRQAVDRAREQVAALFGAEPKEIVFTSGGTEANNHIIKSVAQLRKERGRHIILSAIEHPSVVSPCRFLESNGCELTLVEPDETGRISLDAIAGEVRPDTILISVMHANNEVGTIQPIAEIAELAREGGILFHTDAAQSCGKIPTRVRELGVDFLSIAGHKLYAPQGIGAMYIRSGIELEPFHHGATHESGRRAGTEPVPALVGLGAAAALAHESKCGPHLMAMRDRLHAGLADALGDAVALIGHTELRLPNTLCVGFRGKIGSEVLTACPDLCATTGAACHSEDRKRSDVMVAMNVSEEIAFGAVRLSVGRYTTEEEIDRAIAMLVKAVGTVPSRGL